MSLLMQALKKAERERAEQAPPPAAAPDDSQAHAFSSSARSQPDEDVDFPDLQLEPLAEIENVPELDDSALNPDLALPAPPTSPAPADSATPGLGLAPQAPLSPAEPSPAPGNPHASGAFQAQALLNARNNAYKKPALDLEELADLTPEFAPAPPKPAVAQDAAPEAAQVSSAGTPLEEGKQARMSGFASAPDLQRMQAEQQSQQQQQKQQQKQAQSMLATRKPASNKRLALIALLGLSALSLGGAWFFLATQNQANSFVAPLPPGAGPGPGPGAAAPALATAPPLAAPPATAPTAAATSAAPPLAAAAASPASANSASPLKQASAAQAAPATAAPPPAARQVLSNTLDQQILRIKTPAQPGRQQEARQEASTAARHSKAGAIVLEKRETPLLPILQQAWQAWQNGQPAQARTLWLQVLQADADNRDAHLGLAAAAQLQGQEEQAAQHYLRLLEIDPLDPDAAAALTGMQSMDAQAGAARINKILLQHPQAPALHFVLGNLYAQQQRWNDAQQSYFRAYTLAPGNPDYQFNLAIALDRLGQSRLALEYYQKALSTPGASAFAREAAQTRVAQLQAAGAK
ncbi:tetratricopeptide repeat protein [Massilia sp. W12]|uniref:tetratricopeptide repeat protein n=1 Tax=Massilia sp. W12 TaxID=3126507 RepID=UPI0030CBA380